MSTILVHGRRNLSLARYALLLLLERRLWFFLVADGFLLFTNLITILLEGAFPQQVYRQMVLFPTLLLQLPALSTVVALERKSGCLDLALAVPSTEAYFLRRMAPVCVFFVLQGWVVLLCAPDFGLWPRLAAMGTLAEIVLLLAAVTLFWAVRLRTAGAVLVASLLSVVVFSSWVLAPPFPPPALFSAHGELFNVPIPVLSWIWQSVVLVGATLLFYLYTRRRLRRPETLLS